MNRDQAGAALSATLADLGDEELEVVLYLAQRLLAGQRSYGRLDLARDARDFDRERAEELADAMIYTSMAALKRTLAGKPVV